MGEVRWLMSDIIVTGFHHKSFFLTQAKETFTAHQFSSYKSSEMNIRFLEPSARVLLTS